MTEFPRNTGLISGEIASGQVVATQFSRLWDA
jgi:hypothetical protein